MRGRTLCSVCKPPSFGSAESQETTTTELAIPASVAALRALLNPKRIWPNGIESRSRCRTAPGLSPKASGGAATPRAEQADRLALNLPSMGHDCRRGLWKPVKRKQTLSSAGTSARAFKFVPVGTQLSTSERVTKPDRTKVTSFDSPPPSVLAQEPIVCVGQWQLQ